MNFTHLTEAQAAEMAKTVRSRSQSFIEFAFAAAQVMNDVRGIDLYGRELDRRAVVAEVERLRSLDAVVVGGEDL